MIKIVINKKFRKLLSFTLAEVLITLAIIGVIASITIPAIIITVQKIQYVNSLKKVFVNFSQIFIQIGRDKGCTGNLACTGLFSASNDASAIGGEIIKYIKVIKNCGISTTDTCFPSAINDKYDGTGADTNYNAVSSYKFITADGMSVLIGSTATDCTTDKGNRSLDGTVCGSIVVDLNGLSSPNKAGRDVFGFYIVNNGALYPVGGQDRSSYSWDYGGADQCASPPSGYDSLICTGRIIEEGWKMNY